MERNPEYLILYVWDSLREIIRDRERERELRPQPQGQPHRRICQQKHAKLVKQEKVLDVVDMQIEKKQVINDIKKIKKTFLL